ncbi:winged helix-turn-helix transcriptional regulator [Rhodococcus sp. 077-4]|uniref:winged helix-turn-helix transcriptional regulator n=1 Tax=Rhodococcus sp. 077-4 TaxID=2789271 RepID=UPI0039F44B02
MKSYGQFCSLARSLDVVGDRWTLLIVRELLIGPSRYSDLLRSLPGIASNLLADRLRMLAESGVVNSEDAPPPTSAKVYSLTERGRSLQPVLVALAHWGVPYMAAGKGGDNSRGRWLGFAILSLYPNEMNFGDTVVPLRLRIDSEGDHILVEAGPEGLTAVPCSRDVAADVTISGESDDVFGFLAGQAMDYSQIVVVGGDDARRKLREFTKYAHTYGAELGQLRP